MSGERNGPAPSLDWAGLARTAAANATREYPYALVTVVEGPDDLRLPRAQHPAFHGCYDWHSAVHTHWLLVRLLRDHGDVVDRAAAVAVLDAHLTPGHLAAEAVFLAAHPSFERPYGWAWLAGLAAQCREAAADLEPAGAWADALAPAADVVVGLVLDWLDRAGRPVRDGTHASTAYALGLLLDAAGPLGRDDLATAVTAYAQAWFVPDRDAPLAWEPSGQDFLSPGLSEAALVARVLDADAFGPWLADFWPGLGEGVPRSLLEPVEVLDRTDGQLGHLDGLNLSRSTALARLALALADGDPRRPVLQDAASAHLAVGLSALAEDGYQSTHWLGTFAVLALGPAER